MPGATRVVAHGRESAELIEPGLIQRLRPCEVASGRDVMSLLELLAGPLGPVLLFFLRIVDVSMGMLRVV